MNTTVKLLAQPNANRFPGHRVRVILPANSNRLTQRILAIRFGADKGSPTGRPAK